MKPSHAPFSLFDKLGRDGVRYLGGLALDPRKRVNAPAPAPSQTPAPRSVGEFLLEAFSSGAPRLIGRG